jgi:hypothetical protein
MPAERRRDIIRPDPGRSVDRRGQVHAAPRHYVVFRETMHADGSTARRYDVQGSPAPLDEPGFGTWLRDHAPGGRAIDLVSVLVIQEVLDRDASIVTCCLERRRGSATGPFRGEPARVTFTGAIDRVRLYRATTPDTLEEMIPPLDHLPPPPSRLDQLTGDVQAVCSAFGASARILDVRAPTVLEDMVGLTCVAHLRTPDGSDIDTGLGWHGTVPFVLRAGFPRFGTPVDLTASDADAIAEVAVRHGLTTFETRLDANGPAVVARSRRDGTLHLIRPTADGARVEAHVPDVPASLLSADQTIWASYVQAYEHLTLLDCYADGRSDNVFVFAGAPDGQVTRHLIDADGTEVWRALANDAACAALHRDGSIGRSGD